MREEQRLLKRAGDSTAAVGAYEFERRDLEAVDFDEVFDSICEGDLLSGASIFFAYRRRKKTHPRRNRRCRLNVELRDE